LRKIKQIELTVILIRIAVDPIFPPPPVPP
jgi:hypothetical protein